MNSRRRAQDWPFPRHRAFSSAVRDAAAAWFLSKDFATHPRMPFCLAEWRDWPLNIIVPEVAAYIGQQQTGARRAASPFPLHKYVHHGMSSQAMAFNLVGPLVVRGDYAPLIDVLAQKQVPGAQAVAGASFEYEDRDVFHEDTGQPTSVDVVLKDAAGTPRVFVECKLDEREFGGCSVFGDGDCSGRNPIGDEDACFLHFLGRTYWTLMARHGVTDLLKADHQCIFTSYYQFFRELLMAVEKEGTFVLLSDERSPVYRCVADGQEKGLMPFLTGLLPPPLRARVASVSVQELVAAIERGGRHQDWVGEFRAKYGLM